MLPVCRFQDKFHLLTYTDIESPTYRNERIMFVLYKHGQDGKDTYTVH